MKTVSHEEVKACLLSNPDVQRAYDDLEPKYAAIAARMRKGIEVGKRVYKQITVSKEALEFATVGMTPPEDGDPFEGRHHSPGEQKYAKFYPAIDKLALTRGEYKPTLKIGPFTTSEECEAVQGAADSRIAEKSNKVYQARTTKRQWPGSTDWWVYIRKVIREIPPKNGHPTK